MYWIKYVAFEPHGYLVELRSCMATDYLPVHLTHRNESSDQISNLFRSLLRHETGVVVLSLDTSHPRVISDQPR
jgi:hypothetical protein